jgi:hypothetical protein
VRNWHLIVVIFKSIIVYRDGINGLSGEMNFLAFDIKAIGFILKIGLKGEKGERGDRGIPVRVQNAQR